MQAVITVVGKDAVGILAKVCAVCANANVNVVEVSQRILGGMFAMIMLVDIENCSKSFTEYADELQKVGENIGVDIRCTRQELYDAMHRI